MNLRGLHLHIDCASGAAGDMTVGALIDLGVPLDVIGAALDAIGAGRQRLRVLRVVKHGIASVDIKVDTSGEISGLAAAHDVHLEEENTDAGPPPRPLPPPLPERDAERTMAFRPSDLQRLVEKSSTPEPAAHRPHPHARPRMHVHSHAATAHAREHPEHEVQAPVDHHHAEHAHYHYADIRKRIEGAPLTDGTKRRALDIFDRIARAEAKLHGKSVDDVAFHEVGAIDSVVDVVATAAALDFLAPASVTCTSVAMGHGTITCAHGVLPVPAPAALEVLREAGGVMADGGVARELCTPTGAAILAHAVTSWTSAPAGKPVATGWGAGDVDLADRANVLRVTALELAARDTDAIWQIEANLDDMSPELCAPAADAIFAAGAVDVWWSTITMKKGRPALTLSALAADEHRAAVIAAVLRETTTIGVRFTRVERTVLARSTVEVATRYGTIPVKVARDGDAVLNAAPEYEACAAAAKQHNVPVKLVFAAALAAFDHG
ncbi:MAG: nickel pincer cofactor biosynthesis protein LarC [Myxococcota bacterium]|nr:nickel pincer cofactor biosynthesis protein LarC [Myxococcota bacterium]